MPWAAKAVVEVPVALAERQGVVVPVLAWVAKKTTQPTVFLERLQPYPGSLSLLYTWMNFPTSSGAELEPRKKSRTSLNHRMSLSRSVPITLFHNYRNIPFSVQDACQSCFPMFDGVSLLPTSPLFPLVQAFFNLDRGGGVTQSDLLYQASQIFPQFSADEYLQAFRLAQKQGIIRSIVPPQINWFAQQPPTRYILSPDMDKSAKNANLVKFLLSLVGGYQSPSFLRWFAVSPSCCNVGNNTCVACS